MQKKGSQIVESLLVGALTLVLFAGNALLHLSHNHAASCHGVCASAHTSNKAGFAAHSSKNHVEAGNCVSCFIVNHRASSFALWVLPLTVHAFFSDYAFPGSLKLCSIIIHNLFLRAPPFASFS